MSDHHHLECPYESCGSSDAFSYNDKGFGKCHSCGEHYPANRKMFSWAKEKYPTDGTIKAYNSGGYDLSEYKTEVEEVTGRGAYVNMRGINTKTMEDYGVLTYSNRQEYKYPSGGIKVRTLPEKGFYAKSGFKGDELFGMNLFTAGSSKMVTITEGELCAMSVSQMLKSGYTNPVVSVPSATPSRKLWENCKEWLDSFEKIILSIDNDAAGDALVEKMLDLFPNKVYRVNHSPYKDANDFLQAGKAADFKAAWWNAKRPSPAGFTSGTESWIKAVREEDPYSYVPTPIKGLNDKIRGWVKGGITVIKAPPGVGKTSIVRYAQYDLVRNQGQVVANLAMEEMRSTTARGLATYELKANVNTQEDADLNGFDLGKVEQAVIDVVGDDRFIGFDIDPSNPLESCLTQCQHAVAIYGADYIFIDHLQRLAYLSGVDNATGGLTELGVKLVEFAKRKNVGIVAISHVNGDGHTKYAKAIEEEAIILIELKRDKLAEDIEERNTTQLTVTKNRPFALTGEAGSIKYDSDTTMVRGE